MWTTKSVLLLAVSAVTITIGCVEFDPLLDVPTLYPLGVDGQRFFYEHYANYSDYGDVPSSIWVLDLESGESHQVIESTPSQYFQCSDDFCVFIQEGTVSDEQVESLVGLQVSTSESFTILEDVGWTMYPVMVDGARVAYLRDVATLTVYDLTRRETVRSITLDEGDYQLSQFIGDQLVLFRWPTGMFTDEEVLESTAEEFVLQMTLVDLGSGEVTDLPPVPHDWISFDLVAGLSSDWVVMPGFPDVPEDEETSRTAIAAYHIATGDWQNVATFEPVSILGTLVPSVVLMIGVYGDEAVIYRFPDESFGASTEAVDLVTGERRPIASVGYQTLLVGGDGQPLMHDHLVYWIDPQATDLVIYDLTTDTQRTIPLDYPGKN